MYNYREAIKADVKEWMEDHKGEMEFDYDTVFEACWVADEVTGNASGSYTFSRYEARQNFFEDADSEDYVYQMVEEGFCTREDIGTWLATSDWERFDVCIRCYLLGEAVQAVFDEMEV